VSHLTVIAGNNMGPIGLAPAPRTMNSWPRGYTFLLWSLLFDQCWRTRAHRSHSRPTVPAARCPSFV